MREESAPGRKIAVIAGRQHGVVTRRQLVEAGLSRQGLTRQVQSGRLHRIHRGVYAVGHRSLSPSGHWLAAVLACGPGSLLSHRSAAGLWGLLRAPSTPVHVTVPSRAGRRRRRGIVIHRPLRQPQSERTTRAGIPVTSLARTLADLRRLVAPAEYRQALREAQTRGHRTPGEAPVQTRSELEELFLRLCRRHRLPTPEVNVRVGDLEVDFLWRDAGVVVETDGFRFHRGRAAFEGDRASDLALRLRGYDVLRFSYVQVKNDPGAVAQAVRATIRRRQPPP